MNISEAIPAPKYIAVPTAVLQRALELGKGHLETLMRVATYLWGDTTLEGTAQDFCAVLGISPRSWQRHIPELGCDGCLLYSQSRHGYYVLSGFPADETEATLLSNAWQQVHAEQPQVRLKRWELPAKALNLFLAGKTTKLSFPVVDILSTNNQPQKLEEKQQQQTDKPPKLSEPPRETTKLAEGGGKTSKLSLSQPDKPPKLSEPPRETTKLSEPQREALVSLRGVGLAADVSRVLVTSNPPAWVLHVVADGRERERNGKIHNLAGWVRTVIERGDGSELLPEPVAAVQTAVAERSLPEDLPDPEPPPPEIPPPPDPGPKLRRLWNAALGNLELQVSKTLFDTYLRDTQAMGMEGGNRLIVAVKNGYAADWLENRLYTAIRRTLHDIENRPLEARFVVWNGAPEANLEYFPGNNTGNGG